MCYSVIRHMFRPVISHN